MSERFEIEPTPIEGLVVFKRRRLGDDRGYLSRVFCAADLAPLGWNVPVAQINESHTRQRGTVRGLHFQFPPFAEKKLVTCTQGAILDVGVDLRKGSPTFLESFAVELSAENGRSMLLPEGFAHGFQALSDDVHLVYVTSAPYRQDKESAVHCLDPAIGIDWPLPVVNLSPRDEAHPFLPADYRGIEL